MDYHLISIYSTKTIILSISQGAFRSKCKCEYICACFICTWQIKKNVTMSHVRRKKSTEEKKTRSKITILEANNRGGDWPHRSPRTSFEGYNLGAKKQNPTEIELDWPNLWFSGVFFLLLLDGFEFERRRRFLFSQFDIFTKKVQNFGFAPTCSLEFGATTRFWVATAATRADQYSNPE